MVRKNGELKLNEVSKVKKNMNEAGESEDEKKLQL